MLHPIRASFVLAMLALACCGGADKQRALDTARLGLSAATSAVDAASQAFDRFDADHQMVIAKTAASLEEGQARLAAYRARRESIVHAFEIAAASISAASKALALASGEGGDLVGAVKLATQAVRDVMAVRAAIDALQGG